MVVSAVLKEALSDAISSGKFIDAKIILFSRRDSSGRICKPKALYANSHVLKSVPYFNDLLSGSFSESEVKSFSEPIDEDDFAEDYGYSSDSDLEEDWDFDSPDSGAGGKVGRPDTLCSQYKEHVETGKVIRIQDVAFITFQAFLLYLYTESINFASFGSDENRKSRSPEIAWVSEGEIPKPSPKSIYRLADKYDVPGLKKAALESIGDGFQNYDIIRETFSVFTSRYKEIRTVQVKRLLDVWLSGNQEESRAVRKGLEEKIDSYAAGELEYAAETFSCMWEASTEEGPAFSDSSSLLDFGFSSRRTSEIPVGVAKFTGYDMRLPLIKSIKEGYLLDRIYWVKRSREGEVEPIYFSSAIVWANLDGGRYLGHGAYFDEKDENGYSEDSDYENEVEGKPEQGGERKLFSVLKFGSSIAWKSLFFYVLTGEIQFAPLKSQGSEDRSKWVLENTKPGSPTPCSPKTIYQLAKKLPWKNRAAGQTLADLAWTDIDTKLTEESNAVETFSSFAARHPEIMALGWQHLDTELNAETTTTSVLGLIKGMRGGDAAHRADALKFGFYTALRKKVPTEGSFALLQCTDENCSASTNPISCDALGLGRIKCPGHLPHVRPMKCSECGYLRADLCTWCKGCQRMFR